MKIQTLFAGIALAAMSATAASAQTAVTRNIYVNPVNGTNSGTVADEREATFTVSGTVDAACVIATNSGALLNLDFGTIGIYADGASGVENAFTMTGPRNGHSRTNLAGCNTANTVTLTKGNGADGLLSDNTTSGYDSNVFQANIPYSTFARYTAVPQGTVGAGSIGNYVSVPVGGASGTSAPHGAWRSEIAIRVDLPVTSKALIAGEYTDEITISIAAL